MLQPLQLPLETSMVGELGEGLWSAMTVDTEGMNEMTGQGPAQFQSIGQ